MGLVIAVLSIIIFAFLMVLIHSGLGSKTYMTYTYFVEITFILIGIESLVSPITSIFLTRISRKPDVLIEETEKSA